MGRRAAVGEADMSNSITNQGQPTEPSIPEQGGAAGGIQSTPLGQGHEGRVGQAALKRIKAEAAIFLKNPQENAENDIDSDTCDFLDDMEMLEEGYGSEDDE